MEAILEISGLTKQYASGQQALRGVDLNVRRGEIFALLGPNGAGKTTLIGIVCGLVRATKGTVRVAGKDAFGEYRLTRSLIGLVPQEIATESFEKVWDTVVYSRALFGRPRDDAYVAKVLQSLSLWEKRNSRVMALSGGMKRRLMIAKALAHEPQLLFLDEPTAGVDVELRQQLWQQVRQLQQSGVTIVLTTHYIEEAEQMADRIGVIHQGAMLLSEEKQLLMKKLGKKELILELDNPLVSVPEPLKTYNLSIQEGGRRLVFSYDTQRQQQGVAELLERLMESGVRYRDLETRSTSLEDIFVEMVKGR